MLPKRGKIILFSCFSPIISHHLANFCYISLVHKLSSLVELHHPSQSLFKSCGKKSQLCQLTFGLRLHPDSWMSYYFSVSSHSSFLCLPTNGCSKFPSSLLTAAEFQNGVPPAFPPLFNSSQRMSAMLDLMAPSYRTSYSGRLRHADCPGAS